VANRQKIRDRGSKNIEENARPFLILIVIGNVLVIWESTVFPRLTPSKIANEQEFAPLAQHTSYFAVKSRKGNVRCFDIFDSIVFSMSKMSKNVEE
jgi:hypothetical protein